MRLQSFDIGIKHMAYCVLEVLEPPAPATTTTASSSPLPIRIVDWNILNLTEFAPNPSATSRLSSPPATCSCETLSKRPCSKKVKYMKQGRYFCDHHAQHQTSSSWLIPVKEIQRAALNKLKMPALVEMAKTQGLDTSGKRKDLLERLEAFFKERCFDLVEPNSGHPKTPHAGVLDLISIGRNMARVLDLLPAEIMQSLTHVIMENQISPIAGRMKTIQGMLMQYYVIRYPEVQLAFVSSMHKSRGTFGSSPTPLPLEGGASPPTAGATYRKHKKDAIGITRKLLEDTAALHSWLPFFESSKKKDDLADSFLQGMWYVRNRMLGT